MARLVGPDDGSRLAYQIRSDNALGIASGLTAVYYADEAATTLADIVTYPDGDPITGSAMEVADTSLLPLFLFPDGVSVVYVRVNEGPATAVYARSITVDTSDFLASANNLSELDDPAEARVNLGLGNVNNTADSSKPVSTAQSIAIAAAQAAAVASSLQRASNLADLASATASRGNLGLGAAAVANVGTSAGTVAAGDDSRIVGAQQLSTLTAKGDIYVATGPGIVTRLPVGSNDQVLASQSGESAGVAWVDIVGGGGGFVGDWDPGIEYQPGEIVRYGDLVYGAIAGAPAGEEPDDLVYLSQPVPTQTAVGDSADYQFLAQVTASELTRVEGIAYYKLAGQVSVPHELRAYDVAYSTTSPLAVATVPGEVAGAAGWQLAPLIGDMRPGKTYDFTLVAGAGTDNTYGYTPAYAFGGQVGALTLVAGGFIASHANVTGAVSQAGTYYSSVSPYFRRRSQYWTRIGGLGPVWIGSNRTVTYAPA